MLSKELSRYLSVTDISEIDGLRNLLTDKYSGSFPNHRFYAGCKNVDDIENFAANAACELFEADHAYIQHTAVQVKI